MVLTPKATGFGGEEVSRLFKKKIARFFYGGILLINFHSRLNCLGLGGGGGGGYLTYHFSYAC